MVDQDFKVFRCKPNGELNFRFFKIAYTAALRLGVECDLDSEVLYLSFSGEEDVMTQGHGKNIAFKGTLKVSGEAFDDVIAILEPKGTYQYYLVTFWPDTQHPDAHHSYTQPLVDTAMSGTPYDIARVAGYMHEKFKDNAGVSPAALMNKLYQEELSSLGAKAQQMIDAISEELEAAFLEAEKVKSELQQTQIKNLEMLDNVEAQSKIIDEQKLTIEAQLKEIASSKNELEALKATINLSNSKDYSESEQATLLQEKAVAVTPIWDSKTGSSYKNLGILGHVKDVRREKDNILLETIDTKGNQVILRDFGYQGFVDQVFNYLSNLKGKPAVFIVTWKPGQTARLASDTMMLPAYRDLWS